jgi:hypothetical protein
MNLQNNNCSIVETVITFLSTDPSVIASSDINRLQDRSRNYLSCLFVRSNSILNVHTPYNYEYFSDRGDSAHLPSGLLSAHSHKSRSRLHSCDDSPSTARQLEAGLDRLSTMFRFIRPRTSLRARLLPVNILGSSRLPARLNAQVQAGQIENLQKVRLKKPAIRPRYTCFPSGCVIMY